LWLHVVTCGYLWLQGWVVCVGDGADRLRGLAAAATPGPWFWDSYGTVHSASLARQEVDETGVAAIWAGTSGFRGGTASNPADARLIALTPDLARWAADAAEELEHLMYLTESYTGETDEQTAALLARLPVGDET
jgi:hypothetical protein